MLHSLTDGIQFREKGDRKGIILSLPPNVPFLFLSQWCHLVVIRKKCLHQCAASIPQLHAQEMSSDQLFPSNSVNYDWKIKVAWEFFKWPEKWWKSNTYFKLTKINLNWLKLQNDIKLDEIKKSLSDLTSEALKCAFKRACVLSRVQLFATP